MTNCHLTFTSGRSKNCWIGIIGRLLNGRYTSRAQRSLKKGPSRLRLTSPHNHIGLAMTSLRCKIGSPHATEHVTTPKFTDGFVAKRTRKHIFQMERESTPVNNYGCPMIFIYKKNFRVGVVVLQLYSSISIHR